MAKGYSEGGTGEGHKAKIASILQSKWKAKRKSIEALSASVHSFS